MSTSGDRPRHIVIVGGGVVGCTAAHYLCAHPAFAASGSTVTLVEASRCGVAQGASGKAGGLVAQWAYPKELVTVSFSEHARLAQAHDGARRWGWRLVGCGSWEGRGEPECAAAEDLGGDRSERSLEKTRGLDGDGDGAAGLPDDLDWVRADLTDGYAPMAPAGATAQVHPYLFTTSMLALAQERGCTALQGKVTSIVIDAAAGRVSGVTYTASAADGAQHTLPATHVVLAAGAWSPRLVSALPITGTRAHSVTIRPPPGATVAPYVLFTEIRLPGTARASPEIYPRPDGDVYVCGPGDSSALPETVDAVVVDPAACENICAHVASISPVLREGTVDKRQACFLPVVSTGGGPIVGEATKLAKGLVITTGHTCWGICNAPGTAKAVSELIMEGKISCANLKKLQPAVFL